MYEMNNSTQPSKLLLHACCGPCATAVVERLMPDYDIELFWFNPNIEPEAEAQKRLENLRTVARYFNIPLIENTEQPECWLTYVTGFEDEPEGGQRCNLCFAYRLEQTAQTAIALGHHLFATTLTVSPHKPAGIINPLGEKIAQNHGISFLAENFKQKAGFQRSIELSRELSLYRQRYCGCRYTLPKSA